MKDSVVQVTDVENSLGQKKVLDGLDLELSGGPDLRLVRPNDAGEGTTTAAAARTAAAATTAATDILSMLLHDNGGVARVFGFHIWFGPAPDHLDCD